MKAINTLFISILFISLSLLTLTVFIAINNPAQLENLFLSDYKSVDREYERLLVNEKDFDKEVAFSHRVNRDKLLISLNSGKYNNFNITSFLTRPHTNKDNKELNTIFSSKEENTNKYTIDLPTLKQGHWRIIIKINIKDIVVYKNIDIEV